jgi:galactosamine-6-phosphate isomerase
MQVRIFKDNPALSVYAADEMLTLLKENPSAVICMASGDSPALTCGLFVKKAITEKIDVSKFFFIGLDEWVGLPPGMAGSCRHDFQQRIIAPLDLSSSQYHFFNAMADDLKNECAAMDKIIRDKGGIDLMVVGIGMNGHIGFNEPGTDFNLLSHVTELDETTIRVGQKYFSQPVTLKKGITLGPAHLMAARKVFMLANGTGKAPVIKKAVEEKISPALPASIMQQHSNGFILVDEEAGSLLAEKYSA